MKGKILGCYTFKSKKGDDLVNFSVIEDRLSAIGTCSCNVLALKKDCPAELKDMINKTYVIDTRYNNGSAFASAFYEVK